MAAYGAFAGSSAISIEVTGTVQPRCSNTGFDYPLRVQDIVSAGTSAIQFEVDCNAPFEYSLESQNGGLKLDEPASVGANLAAELPYTVFTHIPLNSGRPIDDVCASNAIKTGNITCHFTNSGSSISIRKQGEMKVVWQASARPLASGLYRDRLTVKLSIRP